MIVTELLHVEVVYLERSMRRAGRVSRFRALEEEGVVVRYPWSRCGAPRGGRASTSKDGGDAGYNFCEAGREPGQWRLREIARERQSVHAHIGSQPS